MNKTAKILTVHAVNELFRFKSFFFLIFFLIIIDAIIHRYVPGGEVDIAIPVFGTFKDTLGVEVFEKLPGLLKKWFFDYRIALLAVGLFLVKQIISMWPSSDMRRMHRFDRSGFGIWSSLFAIRWRQVLWDAVAVGSICGVASGWAIVSFYINSVFWSAYPSILWVLIFGMMLGSFIPLVFAGFSYSSKLAVISRGSFSRKLGLFFRLLTDKRVFLPSWIFFSIRLGVEFICVGAIPAVIMIKIDDFWLRILVASLWVTPIYSYLKMASFKFFLQIYRDVREVQDEYRQYYLRLYSD